MPSADFCGVFSAGLPPPSVAHWPPRTAQISRGKTRILPRIGAGFTKCIRRGVAAALADGGLGGHVPTGPGCITPHIRFLFIAPRFRLGLPPHPASRRRTCPSTHLRLCCDLVPGLSPSGIRAMHGTHRDRKEPCGPSLPHHRAYGSRTRRFVALNACCSGPGGSQWGQAHAAEEARGQGLRQCRGFRYPPRAVRALADVPCFAHGHAPAAQLAVAPRSPLLPCVAA